MSGIGEYSHFRLPEVAERKLHKHGSVGALPTVYQLSQPSPLKDTGTEFKPQFFFVVLNYFRTNVWEEYWMTFVTDSVHQKTREPNVNPTFLLLCWIILEPTNQYEEPWLLVTWSCTLKYEYWIEVNYDWRRTPLCLRVFKDLRYNPKIDEQYFWNLVDGYLI